MRLDGKRTLMRCERFVETLHLGERHAAIGDRRHLIGIYRKRAIVAVDRLGEAFVFDKGIAAVHQRGEVFWIERERLVETGERLVVPVELQQGAATIDRDIDAIGRLGQCRVVAYQRLGKAAQFCQHDTTGIERVGMRRMRREDLVAGRQRRFKRAQLEQPVGAVVQRAEMVWIERQRGVEFCQRLGVPPKRG